MEKLTQEKAVALTRQVQAGNVQAKERVVAQFAQMVRQLARYYCKGDSELYQDLLQVGSLAVLVAAERYDAGKGASLSGWVHVHIKSRCQSALRTHTARGTVLSGSPRIADHVLHMLRFRHRFETLNGRPPTWEEVSEVMPERFTPERCLEEYNLSQNALRAYSLDRYTLWEDGDSKGCLGDILHSEDFSDNSDMSIELHKALATLTPRERAALLASALEDYSGAEVGRMMDVSRTRAHQLLREAKRKMQHALRDIPEFATSAT